MAITIARYSREGFELLRFDPPVDVPAGTPHDINGSGLWGVPPIRVDAGDEGEFRLDGVFRCVKDDPGDAFVVGNQAVFNGTGFELGSGQPWTCIKDSPAGKAIVELELKRGTGGGAGEANTASNEGAGAGLALAKLGSNLPFRTLTSPGGTITLLENGDELELEVDPSATASAYDTMTFVGHGLTAGDVGKPLAAAAIWNDLDSTEFLSHVLVEVVDVDTIKVAAAGDLVTLPVALLDGGAAYDIATQGPYVYWDLSDSLYKDARPIDSVEGTPPVLELYDVGGTDFLARVRDFGYNSFEGTTTTGGHFVDVSQAPYNAPGDGSDQTAILQQALDDANGRTIYLEEGTYLIDGLVYAEDNDLTIIGPGKLLVAGNTNGLHVDMPLGPELTVTTVATVNSSVAANSPSVTDLTITGHGLVVGDVVKVFANATYDLKGGIASVVGEIAQVAAVPDANTVRLHKQLEGVLTSHTGVIARKLSDKLVKLDLRVDVFGSQVTPQSGNPRYVRVSGAQNAEVNIQCREAHQTILFVRSAWGGTYRVTTQRADDISADNVFGYGIRFGGATVNAIAIVNGSRMRHAFTTADEDGTTYETGNDDKCYAFGMTLDCTVSGVVTDCTHAAFDTHAVSQRIVFHDCHVDYSGLELETDGSLPVAFQLRGRDCSITDSSTIGGRYGLLDISMAAHKGTYYTRCEGANFRGCRLRAIEISGNGWNTGDKHYVFTPGSIFEGRSLAGLFERCHLYLQQSTFIYNALGATGWATQMDNVEGILDSPFFRHTTSTDAAAIRVNTGTTNLRIRSAHSEIPGTDITDAAIHVAAGATCNYTLRDWTTTLTPNTYAGGVAGGPGTLGGNPWTQLDEDIAYIINNITNLITNTELADMPAWTFKARNAGTLGDPQDVALADIAEELAPTTGHFIVGFLGTGEIRKFDVGNLPTGGGGEANTASNAGLGVGVFQVKTGVDLVFHSLSSATGNVLIVDIGDEITIDVDPAQINTSEINNDAGFNNYVHPNHIGDVTSVGDGATTITDNVVTYAKIQDVTAASRIVGRGSAAGAGDPEELTVGTMLVISGTELNVNPANIATSTLNNDTGWNAYVHPNHSGDVTSVADGAQTIANNVVTYAKMQDISGASLLLGRGSAAGAGDPEEITLGTNLSMSGTTLNATGGGGLPAFFDAGTISGATTLDFATNGPFQKLTLSGDWTPAAPTNPAAATPIILIIKMSGGDHFIDLSAWSTDGQFSQPITSTNGESVISCCFTTDSVYRFIWSNGGPFRRPGVHALGSVSGTVADLSFPDLDGDVITLTMTGDTTLTFVDVPDQRLMVGIKVIGNGNVLTINGLTAPFSQQFDGTNQQGFLLWR